MGREAGCIHRYGRGIIKSLHGIRCSEGAGRIFLFPVAMDHLFTQSLAALSSKKEAAKP
jgi:hypothetical protein